MGIEVKREFKIRMVSLVRWGMKGLWVLMVSGCSVNFCMG